MSRRLVLMRHAAAARAADAGGADPDDAHGHPPDYHRPLTADGRRDAQLMGAWLGKAAGVPDRVVTSPAVRAAATAHLAAQAMGYTGSIQVDERLYMAAPDTLLSLAEQWTPEGMTLVVGHNPSMEGALRVLCPEAEQGPDGKLFPPATIAVVGLPPGGGMHEGVELIELARPGER